MLKHTISLLLELYLRCARCSHGWKPFKTTCCIRLERGQTPHLCSLKMPLPFPALRTGLRSDVGCELDGSLALIFGKQVNFTTILLDGRKSHLMPSYELEKNAILSQNIAFSG